MTRISRFEDWPRRLEAVLAEAEADRFEWGRNDCGLLVARAIEAMTGVDIAADLKGYTTEDQASDFLRSYAGGGLPEACEKLAVKWEFDEVDKNVAQRGDAAIVSTIEGIAVGVIDLSGRHVAIVSHNGLVRVPVRWAQRAWHI